MPAARCSEGARKGWSWLPTNTVVGQAFRLPVIKEPTKEDVDKWHKKYIESLVELFDTHKERFGYGGRTLEVV